MTSANYAIVANSIVTNIVVWDDASTWTPPSGSIAAKIPAATFVDIGYTYDGTTFAAPVESDPTSTPSGTAPD